MVVHRPYCKEGRHALAYEHGASVISHHMIMQEPKHDHDPDQAH